MAGNKNQRKKTPRRRVLIWNGGGRYEPSEQVCRLARALPVFPLPAPLRQGALIEYCWGEAKTQIIASACSLRATPWGDERVTWLHCKAIPTAEIKNNEPIGVIVALIPAHYVVRIEPGTTFRFVRTQPSSDLCLFPPSWPPPPTALPLEIIERVLEDLLTPERN